MSDKLLYFFIANAAKVKSDFRNIYNPKLHRFFLICSDSVLNRLNNENKKVFEKIFHVKTIDENQLIEILNDYIFKYGRDSIKILTNDETAILYTAKIREHYQLEGSKPSQVLPFTDKVEMKKKLTSQEINKPRYLAFDGKEYANNPEGYLHCIEESINYPFIVKPSNLAASTEVEIIHSFEQIKNYSNNMLNKNIAFEINEYITGTLFHCDGLIKDGKNILFLAWRYNTPCMNFVKGHPLGSILLPPSTKIFQRLENFTHKVLEDMLPPDGGFHLEIFLTPKDELYFLEIACRTPGAAVGPAIEKIGCNLEEQHFRCQMHLPLTIPDKITDTTAWMIYPIIEGVVKEKISPNFLTINNTIEYYLEVGQTTIQSSSLFNISATILIWDQSYDNVEENFKMLDTFYPIIYIE